jgi:hypothetical protein
MSTLTTTPVVAETVEGVIQIVLTERLFKE